MERDELYYYLNSLLVGVETLTPLLESAMESEGMTRVEDEEIEELYHVLKSPLDRVINELEVLLYENSQRYREDY